MSVSAQAGDFGFALQDAKIGAGPFSDIYEWFRAEALSVRMDLIQGDQILPPEVSPTIVPKGAYKDSLFGAGQVDLLPRMQRGFGVLLFALMGDVSTVTGVDADGVTVATANTHIFKFADPATQIPWFSMRRMIPGSSTADNKGDTFWDAKLNSVRFTIGSRGPIAARLTAVSRDIAQEADPSWTWDNDYEDMNSIPHSIGGFLKVVGTEYPITGMVLDFNNGVTSPQQEQIIGDPRPDDFIPLYRTATLRFVYKWQNQNLYNLIRNGGTADQTWDDLPYIFKTIGGSYGFELSMPSPLKITGTHPYDFRVRGNAMVLAPDGPIELAGATLLQQAFTATLLDPASSGSSGDFIQFVLTNKEASYAFAYTI